MGRSRRRGRFKKPLFLLLVLLTVPAVAAIGDLLDASRLPSHITSSSPVGVQCPGGFERSSGIEPHSGLYFTVCASDRYLLTFREGTAPQGLDLLEGRFLSVEEIRALLDQ